MTTELVVTVAFLNAGRGAETQVRQAWHHLRAAGHNADVIVAVEVDEGDRGYSDHSLIRRILRRFRRTVFRRSREVILTRPGIHVESEGQVHGGRSVRHWSPSRPASFARLMFRNRTDTPLVRVITGHPAAGADQQAKNRPGWARKPLQISHDATLRAMADQVAAAHARDEHAVVLTDANARHIKVSVADAWLFIDAPDFGYVRPALGWHLAHVEHATFANPIEPKLHAGHVVTFTLEQHATVRRPAHDRPASKKDLL